MRLVGPLLVLTTLLAACSSTPDSGGGAASSAERQPPAAGTRAPSNQQANASGRAQTTGAAAIAEDAAPGRNSVYFEYDSSDITNEYRAVVVENARYVSSRRPARVTVQGNADERGSREYNLALGQRRAEAVKKGLTLLGVAAERIEAVSFGEEKPRSNAATESAYAENRRADIVYGAR